MKKIRIEFEPISLFYFFHTIKDEKETSRIKPTI